MSVGPRPFAAVNSLAVQVPGVSLGGVHLLVDGWLVFDPVEVLAVEVGEGGAVAGVAEEEVEHGPDEREAAGLAGEPADHLGAPADLAE